MRKLVDIFCLLLLMTGCETEDESSLLVDEESKSFVYYSEKCGDLYSLITSQKPNLSISSLKVVGLVNNKDILSLNLLSTTKGRVKNIDLGKAVVVEGVLQRDCFRGLGLIEKITYPSSVKETGSYPMGVSSNYSVKEIILPEGIEEISNYGLYCFMTAKVKSFPSTLTEIGSYGLAQMDSLEIEEFPVNVNKIGNAVFYKDFGCLKRFNWPSKFTKIPDSTFSCSSLETITLPDNLTEIGDDALSCYYLKGLSLPPMVKVIGKHTFYAINLTSAILPASVRDVHDNAFTGKNIEVVVLNEGLEKLGSEILYKNEKLKEIVLPGTIKEFGSACLASAYGLQSVTIEDGITQLGKYMFSFDENLTEIHSKCTTPPDASLTFSEAMYRSTVLYEAFNKSNCTLYVPSGCKDKYLANSDWQGFKDVIEE